VTCPNLRSYVNTRTLILTAALTLAMQCAHAQLNCANPANIGSGDQGWGTGLPGNGLAPNELAEACGTVALGFYSLANDTGSLNSAFGTNAMFSNTSGASNSTSAATGILSAPSRIARMGPLGLLSQLFGGPSMFRSPWRPVPSHSHAMLSYMFCAGPRTLCPRRHAALRHL